MSTSQIGQHGPYHDKRPETRNRLLHRQVIKVLFNWLLEHIDRDEPYSSVFALAITKRVALRLVNFFDDDMRRLAPGVGPLFDQFARHLSL